MNTNLLFTFVTYLSHFLSTVHGSTCCELRTNAADCGAEQNANCVWFAADDAVTERHTEMTDEFQQCFSVGYAACLASDATCCGPCCGGCPPSISDDPESEGKPPGAPELSECSLGTSTANSVEAGLPAPVGDLIDDARDSSCKTNSKDCWSFTQKSNDNFSPSLVTFLGVDYDTSAGACCYQYTSVFSGTANCDGKTPEQSHLVFDIDCPVGDFSISSASSAAVGYGLDGSTCYWGIKIDSGCGASDTCSYNICVEYANLAAGECPTTTSWVMDKASNVFSFNSLHDGIPSCAGSGYKSQLSVEGITYGSMLVASNELIVGMVMISVLVVAALVYRRYYDNKNEKYVPIHDGSRESPTFNKV